MRIALALSCAGLIATLFSVQASANDLGCADIKRALVAANLDYMRIERGPLPPAPVQAALVIGQMSALTRLAQGVCSDTDAGIITKVVGLRLSALQKLLPVVPEEPAAPAEAAAETAQTAQTTVAADPAAPPTPPPAPPSESRRHTTRKAAGSTSCRRSYYMKEGHRYWRCKR